MLAPAKTSLHSGAHAPAPSSTGSHARIGCLDRYMSDTSMIEAARGHTPRVTVRPTWPRDSRLLYLRHPGRLHRFQRASIP